MTEQPAAIIRSTFVTALAWIFIALAGFATLISILQNVMIAFMFPVEEMEKAATHSSTANVPWFVSFMFSHIRLFFLSFLIVSTTTLTAAIGLLLRKNWARIVFVAIMALGIVWNVGGVVVMFFIFSSMQDISANAQPGFNDNFDTMWKVMMVFNFLMVAGFVCLFGWIIKRLVSEEVRCEFAAASNNSLPGTRRDKVAPRP